MAKFISRLKEISAKFNAEASTDPVVTPDAEKAAIPKSDKEQDRLSEPLKAEASTEGSESETETTAIPESENQQDAPNPPKKRSLERLKSISAPLQVLIKPFTGEKPLHRRPLFWLSLGMGGGAIALGSAMLSLERSLPNIADVLTYVRDGTLTIKASDGTKLQQMGESTYEDLRIEEIPKPLIQAFIAAEDRRFYQHHGIDYQGILRAVASNLQARNVVEGGSTLTQQLARIVFLTQKRSFWRKIKEARLAQKIEDKLNKQQILERYLNLVYLGSGAYGIADASWVYFSKPVNELTVKEMATLAGLAPAPSEYSPFVNEQACLQRRNLVLQRMQESGFITEAQAKEAIASPLDTKRSNPKRLDRKAPYFTDYIQKQLPNYVSPELLEVGGLTVETTLQPEWQKSAEDAVKQTIEENGRGANFKQAALVAIDPRDGQIRAMVGGNEFYKNQFNRVTQAQRQPGSTFKAFVYTTAIGSGFSPYRGYLDVPFTVDGYTPKNYSEKQHKGWLSIRDALIASVNVVAVRVLIDVGWQPVIDLAHKMGIESELKPFYSIALGGSEVNLLELTSAYGTFATNGLHTKPYGIRRIIDRRGKIIYKANFKSERVLDTETSAIMTWMLRGVVNEGTGGAAQLDRPVAGKTGTSDEARDLWFIGYIPQMVAGVWLGNDNNQPTWGASSIAAQTWHNFMVKVIKDMPIEQFPKRPDQLEDRKAQIKRQPIKTRSIIEGSIEPEKKEENSNEDRPRRRRSQDDSGDRPRRQEEAQPQEDSRPRYRRRRRADSDESASLPRSYTKKPELEAFSTHRSTPQEDKQPIRTEKPSATPASKSEPQPGTRPVSPAEHQQEPASPEA